MTRPCSPKPNPLPDQVAEFLARGGKIDVRQPGESALDPVFMPVQQNNKQKSAAAKLLKEIGLGE